LGKFIDLTGQRFDSLVVIERVKNNKHNMVQWLCKCDCGNEIVLGRSLKRGMSKKSCGCQNKIQPNRLKYGEASFNLLFRQYKSAAKARNYSFELTKEYFKKITKQNCCYCEAESRQIKQQKTNYGGYVYNGIDRVDNSIGYTEDNTVACCGVCNHAKKNMSKQDFLSWVERVYNHSIKKEN